MKILQVATLVMLYVGLLDFTCAQLPGLPLDCPIGWKKNFRNNMCYWFNNKDFSPQYKANQKCGNRGGHLASIRDMTENKFITDNYEINPNNTAQSQYAWIGLYELRLNKWIWEEDRSELDWDAPWAPGQPDDFKGEDHTAIEAKTGEWYDMRSNKDYAYICQKAIGPDKPTKPPIKPRTTAQPPPPAGTTRPRPRPPARTTQAQPPPPARTTQAPPPPPARTTQPPPPPTVKSTLPTQLPTT